MLGELLARNHGTRGTVLLELVLWRVTGWSLLLRLWLRLLRLLSD
jgi:hypothetical protein